MLFVAGVELRLFAWSSGGGISVAGILFGLNVLGVFNPLGFLHEYQMQRIRVLFNPDLDPLGAGYHISQSKIAIGSGGLTGKGFMEGTQSGLNFLPQQHTDFIYSVVSEEWGFVGSVAVIALMVLLILWAIQTARKARDFTGSLLAMGVATIFFLHCAINIGMTTGDPAGRRHPAAAAELRRVLGADDVRRDRPDHEREDAKVHLRVTRAAAGRRAVCVREAAGGAPSVVRLRRRPGGAPGTRGLVTRLRLKQPACVPSGPPRHGSGLSGSSAHLPSGTPPAASLFTSTTPCHGLVILSNMLSEG